MPDEPILRQKAREVVQRGKLPARRPDRVWGGPGVGQLCPICEIPVGRDDMEFQIEFAYDGASPRLDIYHFHIRCFAAWEFERQKAGVAPR